MDTFNISDIPGDEDVRKSAEAHLIKKAQNDPAFRRQLLQNPKDALKNELGLKLPANFEVKVFEETPQSFYMVLPVSAEEDELSDQLLEAVSGGCAKPSTPTPTPTPTPSTGTGL